MLAVITHITDSKPVDKALGNFKCLSKLKQAHSGTSCISSGCIFDREYSPSYLELIHFYFLISSMTTPNAKHHSI